MRPVVVVKDVFCVGSAVRCESSERHKRRTDLFLPLKSDGDLYGAMQLMKCDFIEKLFTLRSLKKHLLYDRLDMEIKSCSSNF